MILYKSYNPKTKHVSKVRAWDIERLAERAEREPEKIFFLPECWENVVDAIRYKQGWGFEFDYDMDLNVDRLYIEAMVPDRDNAVVETIAGVDVIRTVWLRKVWILPEFVSEEIAHSFIRAAISEMEQHEINKNLSIHGDFVFDKA